MFGFLGFLAWELFKFFLATASDGMPRAGFTRGWGRGRLALSCRTVLMAYELLDVHPSGAF